MNMTMAKLQKFGRNYRQLHTIVSRETIKPSSPTPPHLKIHNFSVIDYFAPHVHHPWIFFYKNYQNRDTNVLKRSLSQSLTQYYPLAGRFLSPSTPHIECTDEGVEFLEASNDSTLDEFILNKVQDKTLDEIIPDALGSDLSKSSTHMVRVQVSRFTCGGVAVAVCVSHKVSDATTMVNFFNHWASIARGGSPINPSFFSSVATNTEIQEYPISPTPKSKYTIRRFMFPNSKLNELKNKISMITGGATTLTNPTRIESLTSLIFNSAIGAAITKSGSLHLSNLSHAVNLRDKTSINFPKSSAGNLSTMVTAKMADSGPLDVNDLIIQLRKAIMELKRVGDVEQLGETFMNTLLDLGDHQRRNYGFSSLCWVPIYQVDFGWGNPVQVMLRLGYLDSSQVILMDSPNGDGIEATVQLEEEEMAIFQKDTEILTYAEDI